MEFYLDIAPKILLWAAVIITFAPFIVVLGAFLLLTSIFIYIFIVSIIIEIIQERIRNAKRKINKNDFTMHTSGGPISPHIGRIRRGP
jgi:hypothetical protein